MKLNKVEQRFFAEILQAELDAPVKANLKVSEDEFNVVVIPQVSQHGYFEFLYFGTPAFIPESKDGTVTWGNGHIAGVHPILEDAWNNQDVVGLELAKRPRPFAPFPPIVGPKINARVLAVDYGHKGRLAIDNNQIQIETSTLKQIEFSLVDFSNFKKIKDIFELLSKEEVAKREAIRKNMESIQGQFSDPVEIRVINPTQILLHAGKEWKITLTEDTEQTRNHISHSGLITKINGEEFENGRANDLLAGLNQFFTFVSCAYRHPTSIIGEDSNGKAVWGQIGKFEFMPRSTNWFDNDSSAPATVYLESLFPKFWDKWQKHSEEITAIIESLVNSKAMQQAGLPKEAVLASFAGLEMLANLVLQNPVPNDDVANVHKALECYQIPHRKLNQPDTPITTQLARKLGVNMTGPDLINSVRNYVAHPLERNTDTIKQRYLKHLDESHSPYFYLVDLCQFYLEYLLLIGLCNYQPQHFRSLAERRIRNP